MTQENAISPIEAPSKKKIAKGTAIALVIALVILFTVVLPAEYGIDPLHTGAALGLTQLSDAAAAPLESDAGEAAGAVQKGSYRAEPKIYKVDAQDLTLFPGQGVEIKYHMEKGAVLVYSWKASGKLLFEFHGEPDQKPHKDYYDSYELDDKVGREQSFGSFTAPSTGIHGWFWENKGEKPVDIRLTTAGFFDAVKMFAGGPPEDLPAEDVK